MAPATVRDAHSMWPRCWAADQWLPWGATKAVGSSFSKARAMRSASPSRADFDPLQEWYGVQGRKIEGGVRHGATRREKQELGRGST
ncbi:MAG: hypothetical protein R3E96_08770 [Planctomycetota bacterium]